MEDVQSSICNTTVIASRSSSEPMSLNESVSPGTQHSNLKMGTSPETINKDGDHNEPEKQDMNSMSRRQFLKYQKKLVDIERDAEFIRETIKTIENGEGMAGVLSHLEVVCTSQQFGRMCVTFSSFTHIKLPSHGLRKGDNVDIFHGGALCRDHDLCNNGVVLEVSSYEVVVTLEDEEISFVQDSSYSLRHHPSLDNIHRVIRGLSDMEDVTGNASRLVEVLFREKQPLPPLPHLPPQLCPYATHRMTFFNKNLDASQQEAVEFVMKQQDLAVVHGPPGTGKTTTLVEIIRQHVKMGVKVLALAPSNLGVDNLVERLDGVGLKVVRVGHPARTTPATQRHTIDALLQSSSVQDVHEEINDLNSPLNSGCIRNCRAMHKDIG